MQAQETLKEYIKEEKLRKIFEQVFDEPTIMALHRTAKKGYFNLLEFVISTGKEANVFRAQDKAESAGRSAAHSFHRFFEHHGFS